MKISNFNNNLSNNTKNLTFGDGNPSSAEQFKALKNEAKKILKSDDKQAVENFYKKVTTLESNVKNEVKEVKIPSIFTKLVRWLGKIPVDKTGNKTLDMASKATKIVLWGNVGKEAVGTTMYTVQALTNEDLPSDKRKFVGMYDLAVGLVSTAFSFIFGVGLEKSIKNGYKGLLKPLSDSSNAAIRGKAGAAIVGLSAFSSIFLQTIIGKRIIAPAIATPLAGTLKKTLEAKEAAKNGGKKSDDNMSSMPPEALILAKNPANSETARFKQKLVANA